LTGILRKNIFVDRMPELKGEFKKRQKNKITEKIML